jgi:uncharacterized protein DUF2071
MRATLHDLVIVTWAVPRDGLAPLIPNGLVPQTIERGGTTALVSVALMHDTTFGQTYAQLNERTYVSRPDGSGPGAYFWLSHANTWQAALFHVAFGVPLVDETAELTVSNDIYRFVLKGHEVARVRLNASSPVRKGEERLREIAANPMIGYTLDRGQLHATRVVHTEMAPRDVVVESIDTSFMAARALIAGAKPIAAWHVAQTPFDIDLPPQAVT